MLLTNPVLPFTRTGMISLYVGESFPGIPFMDDDSVNPLLPPRAWVCHASWLSCFMAAMAGDSWGGTIG